MFESDEERALWTSLVLAINRLSQNSTDLRGAMDDLVNVSKDNKNIHRELMRIFRTQATFMAETPELLNWIMSTSVETKNNLDTMMTIQQQMIKKNQDAKLSIRSPTLSIVTIADYEFIQMIAKVVAAYDGRDEDTMLREIEEWYIQTNVENEGQLSHDITESGQDRFRWWQEFMKWLCESYGLSEITCHVLWGAYAIFFPFATENSMAENPALSYLTTMRG